MDYVLLCATHRQKWSPPHRVRCKGMLAQPHIIQKPCKSWVCSCSTAATCQHGYQQVSTGDLHLPKPPDLHWRRLSSPLQCLPKRNHIPTQDLWVLVHARSWARILPPCPGHNPKRRNPASGWSQAPGRALEADFPEQQGAPDTYPSARRNSKNSLASPMA